MSLSYRYAHDDAYGIIVRNNANSNAVTIEDVTSKFNGVGMELSGPKIKVRDSTTSHNQDFGIISENEEGMYDDFTSMIQFEGTVSSHHNDFLGIGLVNTEVIVKGDVYTYLNPIGFGVIVNRPDPTLTVTVEDSGSLTSCQNYDVDIVNGAGFIDEGTDGYACDTSSESFDNLGKDNLFATSTCVPCPVCE